MPWHRRPAAVAALAEAKELIVRPKFRRAIVAALVFFGASSTAVTLGGVNATHANHHAWATHRLGSGIAIAICALAGLVAVRMVANEVARLARLRGSPAAASALRLILQILGYLVVLITVLGLLAVRVESVLLSGAIGSVVVGLAAQQSLGNAFAGIVLLVSRPFVVGDYITLRAGALGGIYDGEVTGMTLMFTTMNTADGPISLPNAAVLAAAIGRRQRPNAPTETLLR